jgi:hypothetical protein
MSWKLHWVWTEIPHLTMGLARVTAACGVTVRSPGRHLRIAADALYDFGMIHRADDASSLEQMCAALDRWIAWRSLPRLATIDESIGGLSLGFSIAIP